MHQIVDISFANGILVTYSMFTLNELMNKVNEFRFVDIPSSKCTVLKYLLLSEHLNSHNQIYRDHGPKIFHVSEPF